MDLFGLVGLFGLFGIWGLFRLVGLFALFGPVALVGLFSLCGLVGLYCGAKLCWSMWSSVRACVSVFMVVGVCVCLCMCVWGVGGVRGWVVAMYHETGKLVFFKKKQF